MMRVEIAVPGDQVACGEPTGTVLGVAEVPDIGDHRPVCVLLPVRRACEPTGLDVHFGGAP